MRLIHLSTFWTVVIDFIAWFFIHIGVVYVTVRIPAQHFNPANWLYRSRGWERDGRIHDDIFKVRKWKKYLPDGAPLLGKMGFAKKRLRGRNRTYFEVFLVETCRAELTHWIIMLFAPFFFLWNPFAVGFIMIFYIMVENLPLIVAQRYNRYRFRRLLVGRSTGD